MSKAKKARSVKPQGLKYKRSMGPVGGRRNVGHTSSMTHKKYGRRGSK